MRGGKVHAIRVTKDLEMTCIAQRSRLQQRINFLATRSLTAGAGRPFRFPGKCNPLVPYLAR